MTVNKVEFSLIISTLGRTQEILKLFESLEAQTFRNFEVIIVDQNKDDRLAACLKSKAWHFPVIHVPTPTLSGVCRGRNLGWQQAKGEVLLFPDDDCWYPPWLLERARERLAKTGANFLTGRAADEAGRSINGRFEERAQPIDRVSVWTTSIEWMIFFRRHVFEAVGGFDEAIGPGANTSWGANEGQDIILRALAVGFKGAFDPDIFGFHAELNVREPDGAMLKKARFYARGMGFVLGRHGFGVRDIAYWCMRPAAAMLIYAVCGKVSRASYYWNVARGRLEGWFQANQTPGLPEPHPHQAESSASRP